MTSKSDKTPIKPSGLEKTRSISRNLTFSLVFIVIIATTLVVAVNYSFITINQKAELERKADEYVQYLVESLELSIWSINDENVEKIADSYFNNELVARLKIIEENRRLVLYNKNKGDELESDLIKRSTKILHDGKVIGHLELSLTAKAFQESKRMILWSSMITGITIIIGVILTSRYFLRMLLSRPFQQLTKNIDDFAEGNYEISSSDFRYIETDSLMQKFIAMGEKIKSRERSLTEVNYWLEQEVAGRKKVENNLKTSEEQLQSIIGNIPSMLYLKNLKGEYILVNKRFEKIFHLTGAGITGKTNEELLNHETASVLQFNEELAIYNDKPIEFEHIVKTGNDVKTFLSVTFPLHRPDGEIYGVCGISTDISEVKESQQRIEDALDLREKILSESPIGIATYDATGLCLSANDALGSIIAAKKEEVMDQNLFESPVWRLSGISEVARESFELNAKLRHEVKSNTAFQTAVALDCYLVPFMAEGERHILLMISDIKKRIKAETETNRLRSFLKNIIDSMPSMIVGVDEDGRVTQWNLETSKKTGIKPSNALGKNLEDLFPAVFFDLQKVKESIRRRGPVNAERLKEKVGDQVRFFDMSIYPLISTRTDGAVIRVDDVTEKVQIEEMMIQSEKMMSIGGLAAGMAHEINNPLAAILQNVQLMRNRMKVELDKNKAIADECGISIEALVDYMQRRDIFSMIDSILLAGQRASKIVDNVLSFSRKGKSSAFMKHDIAELLDKTLELAENDYDLKSNHDFRKIEIIKDYDSNLPIVDCEASQMQQVFLNIFKNGAQAMLPAGAANAGNPKFKISTQSDSINATITIEDNGPGMDEQTRKRIFEPFFTTKEVGSGTGLGLSLSYFIITKNHKGQLSVNSTPGGGTRFTIQIPIQQYLAISSEN